LAGARPVLGKAFFELDKARQGVREIGERRRGKHDRIAPTADVFGYF
jgi:hypothetical protein